MVACDTMTLNKLNRSIYGRGKKIFKKRIFKDKFLCKTDKVVKAKEIAQVAKKTFQGSHLAGFMDFIREQGVIGLAVGLAIGTAAGDTVKKLVEGFISPIVQFIVGSKEGLEAVSLRVEMLGRVAEFKWGAFVSSAITLVATAFVIYLIINLAKLNKLDKEKK